MRSLLQTSVAVGDIQEIRQNALLRQRELHVSLVCIVLAGPCCSCDSTCESLTNINCFFSYVTYSDSIHEYTYTPIIANIEHYRH